MKFKEFLEEQPKSESTTITCWRGFRGNLEKSGNNYILDPKDTKEGLLWFTHEFQASWAVQPNPRQYALDKAEGGYFVTYPLKCEMYYHEVEGPFGPRKECPKEIMDKVKPTELSRIGMFGACYELPEGWYFTWKMEKHIATDRIVILSPNMIQKIP